MNAAFARPYSRAERRDALGGNPRDRRHALGRILARALAQLGSRRACSARGSRGPRDRSAKITCIIPSASAPSVPGRIGIHSSHWSAVRVRSGSMPMMRAPRARASQHERPEMRVGRERVRSPQQHQIALRNSLGVGADVRADGHAHADGARHRADRAVEHRRAEEMEEAAIHRRSPARGPSCRRTSTGGLPAGRRSECAISFSRAAISSSASSHEMRSNDPRLSCPCAASDG